MRKLVIIAAGVAACAPVCVWGTGFGTVVSSFKSPSIYPMGVSSRPGYLYVNARYSRVVWRLTTTGSVISYHPNDLKNPHGMAVGTIGGKTYYWVVDQVAMEEAYVYRFLDNSSKVCGSFTVPPGRLPYGLSFVDPSHMYYTAAYSKLIYLLHPTSGSVYSSYPVGFYAGDLAYDPEGYLWIGSSEKMVYQFTTTGSALASFSTEAWGVPTGCGYDGEYVWVGASDWNRGRYTILQFNVRESPAVLPASVGRVKALFR